MPGDIQAILHNLHTRILAMEQKMGTTLNTRPWTSNLDPLYEDLTNLCTDNINCGWRITEHRRVSLRGVGFTEEGNKFSIEIEDDSPEKKNGNLIITAWEYGASYSPDKDYPMELDEEVIPKDKNNRFIQKTIDYLQRTFPGPWRGQI